MFVKSEIMITNFFLHPFQILTFTTNVHHPFQKICRRLFALVKSINQRFCQQQPESSLVGDFNKSPIQKRKREFGIQIQKSSHNSFFKLSKFQVRHLGELKFLSFG